jgi:hypothetical protein
MRNRFVASFAVYFTGLYPSFGVLQKWFFLHVFSDDVRICDAVPALCCWDWDLGAPCS